MISEWRVPEIVKTCTLEYVRREWGSSDTIVVDNWGGVVANQDGRTFVVTEGRLTGTSGNSIRIQLALVWWEDDKNYVALFWYSEEARKIAAMMAVRLKREGIEAEVLQREETIGVALPRPSKGETTEAYFDRLFSHLYPGGIDTAKELAKHIGFAHGTVRKYKAQWKQKKLVNDKLSSKGKHRKSDKNQ